LPVLVTPKEPNAEVVNNNKARYKRKMPPSFSNTLGNLFLHVRILSTIYFLLFKGSDNNA
jgi:hypothetical protein